MLAFALLRDDSDGSGGSGSGGGGGGRRWLLFPSSRGRQLPRRLQRLLAELLLRLRPGTRRGVQ